MLFLTPVETKPDVFSYAGFYQWLERQPADRKYRFMDLDGGCLIGLYLADHGLDMFWYSAVADLPCPPFKSWWRRWFDIHPRHLSWLAIPYPQTCGAALRRARQLVAPNAKTRELVS